MKVFIECYQAGLVKRHHINPSDAVQTVGAHSWGVAMILDAIWEDAPKRVIMACLRHDVPERWTGDVPAYVKWQHPALDAELGHVEDKIINLLHYDNEFTEQEAIGIKLADMLELYLFCHHRIHMGDRYFKQVARNVDGWFERNPDHFNLFPKARILYEFVQHQVFSANP